MPVVPGTWEAEAVELLEPMRQRRLRSLKQKNCWNLGGRGFSELKLCYCTLAWATEDMDESGNHHSQQTETRTENQTLHILTHRRVLNNENTWTQGGEHHTLESVVGDQERDSGPFMCPKWYRHLRQVQCQTTAAGCFDKCSGDRAVSTKEVVSQVNEDPANRAFPESFQTCQLLMRLKWEDHLSLGGRGCKSGSCSFTQAGGQWHNHSSLQPPTPGQAILLPQLPKYLRLPGDPQAEQPHGSPVRLFGPARLFGSCFAAPGAGGSLHKIHWSVCPFNWRVELREGGLKRGLNQEPAQEIPRQKALRISAPLFQPAQCVPAGEITQIPAPFQPATGTPGSRPFN
ncbi:hypothetical protein AAY473_005573 [Plecturocebus cupreus]